MTASSTSAKWSFPNITGFEIIRRLGGGGASAVFEAMRHDRRVALKIMEIRKPAARARFSREVCIGSMFEHPGVVSPLDAGATDKLG